jgi:hypothetical protein
MESKKINQLATEMAPASTDLTIIGDPITGVSKKVTLLQIADLFSTIGTVTSVGVTETGDALTITGSPITSAGTINIGFAGDATQYVRGDGALADFPTSTGGGSSVSYYLNSSVSQGTIGGVAYRQLSKDPISGAGTDISISANGYIASYITDANDPALLEVPAGNFNCEFYFSVNSNAHNPYVYAELYKYDGTTFTLLGSSQSVPEYLSNGTTLSPYYFAIPVTASVLTITDRLAIRIYANVDTKTVTLHTENNHLCQVVTTFSKGLTTLNNLTRQIQFLATGTSGTDFAISSSTATHTFNLPTASATNRGALSSADWTTFNAKQNAITLTTTGTSGAATLVGSTLNIPQYTDQFVGTVTSVAALTLGTTGTDLSSTVANGTTTPVITLNVPTASATNRGALSSADWTTFNNKQSTLSLTTTGNSGSATLVSNTLNVPTYTLAGLGGISLTSLSATTPLSYNNTTGAFSIQVANTSQDGYLSSTDWNTFNSKQSTITNPVTGTGTSGQVTYFNGTSSVTSSSNFKFDGTNLTIGNPSSALAQLHVFNSSAAASFLLQTNSTTDYSEIAVRNNSSTATSYFRQYSTAATGSDFGISRAGLALFFSNYATNFAIGTRNGGDLIFGTADTERARILASNGYFGIGYSSPSYKLDVNGEARFKDGAYFGASATGDIFVSPSTGYMYYEYPTSYGGIFRTQSGVQSLLLAASGAATFSSSVNIGTNLASGTALVISNTTNARQFQFGYSTGAGYNYFQVYDGTSFQQLVLNNALSLASTGAATFSSSVRATQFAVTPSGTFRVNTDGDAILGYILRSGSWKGNTENNLAFATDGAYGIGFFTNGSTSERFFITSAGQINMNDTVYNNTAVATTRTLYIGSDYRIGGISSIRKSKKNIENVSNVDWIYNLNPVTFNYRKKNEEEKYTEEIYDELVYGLIAEDTAPIADFLVNYNAKEDGSKEMIGIEYMRLITPMLKAIQEQQKQIEELKLKIK